MRPNSWLQHAVGKLYVQHHNGVVQRLRGKLGNQAQALEWRLSTGWHL